MNEYWCRGITKVEASQVDEVDNKKEFTEPEIPTNPQHNEPEGQKVVLGGL